MKLFRPLIIVTFLLLISTSAPGMDGYQSFSFGGSFAYSTLLGGGSPWFAMEPGYGFRFDTRLGGNWRLEFSYSKMAIYDDTSLHTELSFGSNKDFRRRSWKGYDITGLFRYRLMPYSSRFCLITGFGGGVKNWKFSDAVADTALRVKGERGEWMDYAASEIFIELMTGLEYRLNRTWKINIDIRADYLTGLGLEFADSVESRRGRWNTKIGISLSYFFWKRDRYIRKNKQDIIINNPIEPVNLPPDIEDSQLESIIQNDSDNDGIADIDDECPETPVRARGLVDIRGCPIDYDSDGFADYIDSCPRNQAGARVDEYGCPVDSDNDGVPDGLDDCPGSVSELPVDNSGCIDLSILEKPMVLHIKYESGSFEIDRPTQEKLKKLARILKLAASVRVDINGYTDNIGTTEANRKLSEKRALKVRDYLVTLGIEANRLNSQGRGEINFIAPNDTLAGRQKNRRVELIFFK